MLLWQNVNVFEHVGFQCFCLCCWLQFGAETQQSKVAPSSAANRPIQSSREQVGDTVMSLCRQRRRSTLFFLFSLESQKIEAGFPQG